MHLFSLEYIDLDSGTYKGLRSRYLWYCVVFHKFNFLKINLPVGKLVVDAVLSVIKLGFTLCLKFSLLRLDTFLNLCWMHIYNTVSETLFSSTFCMSLHKPLWNPIAKWLAIILAGIIYNTDMRAACPNCNNVMLLIL